MRTRTRLAALLVSCAAALSLTGATATAQTRAQAPAIGTLLSAAGCERVIPAPGPQVGAVEVAGCFWITAQAGAIIGTFDTAEGTSAWLAWNAYPSGTVVIGNGWAAVTTGPQVAATVAGRLGGTVR